MQSLRAQRSNPGRSGVRPARLLRRDAPRNDGDGEAFAFWRRGLLGTALLILLAAGGCGWAPLYADPQTAPADVQLRAIKVAPIAERIGQKLEWALRGALNPTSTPSSQRFVLNTTLQTVRSDLGIQIQGFGTRGRLDATASFTLADIKTGASLLTGTTHVAESFDILANQYANLVAENDARTRAVEEMRRDILDRLTLFMQRRVAQAGARP